MASGVREIIEDIIRTEIADHKSNLDQVKHRIEQHFQQTLSSIDNAFIERKYVEYCSIFWLKETTDFLKNINASVTDSIIKSIDDINSLKDVPNPFKQLQCYKLLIGNYKLVNEKDEKTLVRQFKNEILEHIVTYCDSAKTELAFLETFIEFLNNTECLQLFIDHLKLKSLCWGKLSFDKFLKQIIDHDPICCDASLSALQEPAKLLLQEEDHFLINMFQEVVGDYIKPVDVNKRKIDDRIVVEVMGNIVVVSGILLQLEEILTANPNVEEVRFVITYVIHVDRDFRNEIWHGKNVVVLTKVIKICNKVTWNVSGKDNYHSYNSDAGTGGDGHGKKGADGYAGESGGNVLISAEKIQNVENFTIISNGGGGSCGQNGGRGKDGENGKTISEIEFRRTFPSPVKLLALPNERRELVDKTIKNIKARSVKIHDEWYSGSSRFIEAETSQGNVITFSYYNDNIFPSQSFLLYKGSPGQPGGIGGEYGLGGQGAYAGEIIVKHLEINSQDFKAVTKDKPGEDGENGLAGMCGHPGKSGYDMGYMDYQFRPIAEFSAGGKYKIAYDEQNLSSRVWCPYKDRYAEIEVTNAEQPTILEYRARRSIRQNTERQSHAKATRKKNISQSCIKDTYSHQLNFTEKKLLHFQSDLGDKKLALQKISENQEQQEKQSIESRIECLFLRTPQSKNKLHNDNILRTSYKEITNADSLIDNLKNNKEPLIDNWLEINKIPLDLSQLRQLFPLFVALKVNSTYIQSQTQIIKKLLIDKYRFAALQVIAKKLSTHQEIMRNIELHPKSIARYLEENKLDSNYVHSILDQYLYENSKESHQKIIEFCEKHLGAGDKSRKIIELSLKTFILEVGKSEEAAPCIKQYYKEYMEFLEKPKHNLIVSFDEFKSELDQPSYADAFDLWIESIKDKNLKHNVEVKHAFLEGLYNHVNNHLKLNYDWDKCSKDAAVLMEFNNYIRKKGPLSESCRELLAYMVDFNIKVFIEDEHNNLLLQDNHNPSSKNVTYVLQRNNKLTKLSINEAYLLLEKERKMNDRFYRKVLLQTDSFKQKENFDEYLEKQLFLSAKEIEKIRQDLCNEEETVGKIAEYFSGWEKQQLKERLEKITSQYIGHEGLLHYLLKRFSSEGRHISFQELCFLINSVISSSIEDTEEQNIFCWIVAAFSQNNWTDELTLLQLENYFKRQLPEKTKWREFLLKVKNKYILLLLNKKLDQCRTDILIECIDNILYLLSNIPNETVNLEGLELSEWPYALKEKYWTFKLSELTGSEKDDLSDASYYLLSMENIFGINTVNQLLDILKGQDQKLSTDLLTEILYNFHSEKWNLNTMELKSLMCCNIVEWSEKMKQKFKPDDKEMAIAELIEVIKGNDNTSKIISGELSNIEESIRSISSAEYAIDGKHVISFEEDDIKGWLTKIKYNEENQGNEMEMLAVIDRAIQLRRGFKLRDTQKLTVLVLLRNGHNTLAQVSTGEGKSLIIVAVSIMKSLCGEKVNIITSSSVLAKRDAEGNSDIYSLFDINVSHNCSEDIEKRKEAYSCNQVVYGDLSSFQRDYLLDRFYGKNIFGDHNFENAFVDEVDSMLLDKGNNMLYLSHDLAGLDKLEAVYVFIWQWINIPFSNEEGMFYAFNREAIREAVLCDLYSTIKREDIGRLGPELNEQQQSFIWELLINAGIIDGQGKLLNKNVNIDTLNKILTPELGCYQDRLGYLFKQCLEKEKQIHVPKYLCNFIERHLESWINSAISAFFMKAGEDYVVDVDRTGVSQDCTPNITILDTDTGTDEANSQWEEALHQFLQLKHGCKLSLQSLKAVFISNVSFFKLYSKLYGLTGTLGSQRERDLLREIHNVDFVTIPTAKSKQFDEHKPIICKSKDEWISQVHKKVQKIAEKRSVLIICETVNDVKNIHKAFGGKDAKHVHTYTRDFEEFEIAKGTKELELGQIIIATNLAGRGTDIKITEELRQANGLHVCLTYLPKNIRIEQQAFGRAARNGDKGSGQVIIWDTKGGEFNLLKHSDIRKERDVDELQCISDIKVYYETHVKEEEKCFNAFQEQFKQLKKMFDNSKVPTEIKDILLQSCLDKWAFWLDENNKYLNNLVNEESKARFNTQLNKLIVELEELETFLHKKNWLAFVEGNPVNMVKLGKYFSKINQHDAAIELFDRVIQQEPYFSAAAHYYKAHSVAKQFYCVRKSSEKWKETLKLFKKELCEAARLLHEHRLFAITAASVIGTIKKANRESIIQIDAYEEQQKDLIYIYNLFSQSIEDILGHHITPQSFVNETITEDLAESLYEDLLREGILKKQRVKNNISENDIQRISFDYGVSAKILKDFLCIYEGEEFNEKEFEKDLKHKIQLTSRNEFWKILTKQRVLCEEVKFIMVNNGKLKEIDPSLFDFLKDKLNKKELEEQIPECNNQQISLNIEQIAQENNEGYIFEKNNFVKTVGKNKYDVLKERGLLSFNRIAKLSREIKVESVNLPCFDSIKLQDFTKIDVPQNEAEKILADLVEEKVIEKKIGSSDYKLVIRYEEIQDIKLTFCPVYESAVKGLLFLCFSYRIALQRIANQLEEEDLIFSLQLMSKPHKSLISELFQQRVIKPVKINDFEDKLKSIYSITMTKADIVHMFSQSKLIPEEHMAGLFDYLVENNRITKYNANKVSAEDLYTINSPDKGTMQLNPLYKDIEKTIDKILCRRQNLSKEETIASITRTLKHSRSAFKDFEVPDSKLKPFIHNFGQREIAIIENLHVFNLNGLDMLIEMEEKKWTRKMLIGTSLTAFLGICQIAVGSAMMVASGAVLSHFGTQVISMGVNDINYSIFALVSGYFNRKDYLQTKLTQLIIAALTAGVAYLQSVVNKAQITSKVTGSLDKIGSKKFAKMTGKQMLKKVAKTAARDATVTTIKAVAHGLSNIAVDSLIENCLQSLCENLSSKLMSDIHQEIEIHTISKSMQEAYEKLGEEEAKKTITTLTQHVLDRKMKPELLILAKKIVVSVVSGIETAVSESKTSAKLESSIKAINVSVNIISKVGGIKHNFLNSLDREIKDTLKNRELKTNSKLNDIQKFEEGCLKFKEEMSLLVKDLLDKMSAQIISQHILSPILKKSGFIILRKRVGKFYNLGIRDQIYSEEVTKIYEEMKMNVNEQSCGTSQTGYYNTVMYHNHLLKWTKKTGNHKLLGALIRENATMDVTLIQACGRALHRLLVHKGITIAGLTIVVTGEDGVRQKITCVPEETESRIITINRNHFQVYKSSTSENNQNQESQSAGLYETLVKAIPQLRDVKPEVFCAALADLVEQDQGICCIKQSSDTSWGVGSKELLGPEPSAFDEKMFPNQNEFKRKISDLLIECLGNCFPLKKILQRISKRSNVDKNVHQSGPSECQDKAHNSDVVIEDETDESSRSRLGTIFSGLKHVGGCVQIVSNNIWNIFPTARSSIHPQDLETLERTNFGSLNQEDHHIITTRRQEFIAEMDKQLKQGKLSKEEELEYVLVMVVISNIETEILFEKGKESYLGMFTKK